MSKKIISILTVFALVVSLFAPVAVQDASAATKNKVDRVATVKADTNLNDPASYSGQIPNLILEVDDTVSGGVYEAWTNGEVFRLELPTTAEWKYPTTSTAVGNASVVRLTEQILEVTTAPGLNKPDAITVPMRVAVKASATGEQRVTVVPRDSAVTGGSYTFAFAQDGKTVATVANKKVVGRGNNTGAAIVIDETIAGALEAGTPHTFRLRLPNNVDWNGMTNADIDVTSLKNGNTQVASASVVTAGNGTRNLDVTVTLTSKTSKPGSIIITPKFNIKRDAKYGDITVDITNTSGDISAHSGLVVAEYKDYGVSIEVAEVKEMYAGWEDSSDDDFRTAKITIEELSRNSLAKGRVIDFELPSWAKVATDSSIEVKVVKGGGGTFNIAHTDTYSKRSKFEINVNDIIKGNFGQSNDDKAKFEIKIPLTFKGTESGDVNLKVGGAGIPDQEVTIAKVIAPVTAEVNVSDVRIGIQEQNAPEIIVKETKAGALKEDANLLLRFVEATGFKFDAGAKFEVIEGDLEIDVDKSGRDGSNALKIYIDSESSKPSTIKITNIKMTVDRTAPEGPVKLDITGGAVVNNQHYDDFVNRIARFDFANVITPAPGETRGTSVFAIDSTTYTVVIDGKEQERTMDVAPYIKDSRTFLPVFFVAQALGVSESNIIWDANTKTVTVLKGDRVAQMQIGSKVLYINGTPVQMDTAPEIKDGRTMLPVYFVGQALGASVEWDGDTRTVTVKQ